MLRLMIVDVAERASLSVFVGMIAVVAKVVGGA